jgi:type I restriction enzyme S subunit
MKATDAYRKINNSPIKGIILYYTEQLLKGNKVDLGSVISQIQTGKTPPKAELKYYESSDVNWFKPSDIGYGKFLTDAKEKFSQIAVIEKKTTIYPQNTLLMIGIGGGVGRVSVLKEEGSSNQQITGISFNADVSSEYAYYYYLAREDYIKSKAKSMSFPILNQARIKELDFRYPFINEQNEFVKFIDYCWDSFLSTTIPDFSKFKLSSELKKYALKQFKAIKLDDEIQSNIKKELKLLSQLKQSILQEAIQGKLTKEWREQNPNTEPASELLNRINVEKAQLIKEKKIKKEKPLPPITKEEIPFELPEGWVWCRLGECSVNKDELRKPISQKERERRDKTYDYYGASGCIDKIDNYTHNGTFLLIGEDGSNLRLRNSPIAFTVKGKFWVNNHAHTIQFLDSITHLYIQNHINGIDLTPYITGGFQPKLNQTNLNNILISFPPLSEQKEIVKKVEALMQQCQVLEQEIKQSETNAKMLMQAVLKEAFESKENKPIKM